MPSMKSQRASAGSASRIRQGGLVAVAFLVSFGQDLLGGTIPLDRNTVFRLVFLVLALLAMRVRSERYHVVNAVLSLALFCFYVLEEFLRLA